MHRVHISDLISFGPTKTAVLGMIQKVQVMSQALAEFLSISETLKATAVLAHMMINGN
jgi:hypothetical protein